MTIKEHFNNFKNNEIVQDALNKINPTWYVIKNLGGYKIFIISMLLVMIFMPINALINFISKLLIGTANIFTFKGIIESLISGYSIFSGETIVIALIIWIVSGIISFISFIISTFIVSNANFRSFKILAEEERVVSIGEYFKLAFTGFFQFSWKLFLNVLLPIFIVNVIGNIINIIPFIQGKVFTNLIVEILYFALMFRFLAMMIDLDYNQAVGDFASYWLTFAVVVYLINTFTSLSIVITFFKMMFILFTMLLLTESRYYYGEE